MSYYCLDCGSPLRIVKSFKKEWKPFFGCSSYPQCKASQSAFEQNGYLVPITEVSIEILIEKIQFLEAEGYVSPDTVSFYISGPQPHGEMAMDCYEAEFDCVMDASVSRLLGVLEAELERRDANLRHPQLK